jgi:hypothetical protein
VRRPLKSQNTSMRLVGDISVRVFGIGLRRRRMFNVLLFERQLHKDITFKFGHQA